MYVATLQGNAFLWHQIRCIMAVLMLVGQGKEQPTVGSNWIVVKIEKHEHVCS